VLDGDRWPTPCPGHFTPRKNPSAHYRRQGGPYSQSGGIFVMRKSLAPTGNQTKLSSVSLYWLHCPSILKLIVKVTQFRRHWRNGGELSLHCRTKAWYDTSHFRGYGYCEDETRKHGYQHEPHATIQCLLMYKVENQYPLRPACSHLLPLVCTTSHFRNVTSWQN